MFDFIFKISNSKKKRQINKIMIDNLYYNLNPSEKIISINEVILIKYRSAINEIVSTSSVLGVGINFGVKAGKQVNHRQINATVGQIEETIRPVKLVLTNQRIIVVAVEYSLAIRHLNILGLMFEEDLSVYLLRNQKSMLKVVFETPDHYNIFKNNCMQNTYLEKRLKIITKQNGEL
jgi:hypothetical protein